MTWLLVGVVLLLLWAYSRWRLSYWSLRGIKTPPTIPFFGNVHEFFVGKRWLYMDKVSRENEDFDNNLIIAGTRSPAVLR